MFILGKIDRFVIKEMYPIMFETEKEAHDFNWKLGQQGIYYKVYKVDGVE